MARLAPQSGSRVFRTLLHALIVFALFLATARTATAAAPTAEEIAATAAWFDALDFLPDLRDKPYVEINYGKIWYRDAVVTRPYRQRGFLLAEDDKTCTVFRDGVDHGQGFLRDGWRFGVQQFQKPSADAADETKGAVRRLDLATVADEAIAEARKTEPPDAKSYEPPFGRTLEDRTALFLLARCCARQGRADIAKKLDAEVLELAAKPTNNPNDAKATFRAGVEKSIAHALMWKAVVEFGKPAISRPELLAQFERVVRDYPASEHHDKAAEYAATLRTMIAEDRAHVASAKPLAQMTRDEQVREWIFRLRDQHGEQMGEPGGVEFLEWIAQPGAEPSPGMHLVQLGYAAVPALIEALDDHRFTRSVQCGRSFYFSHYPLTISDCVRVILSRISGQNFRTGDRQKARAEVADWWQQVGAKGEKQMLIDNVSAAIDWSDEQIHRLIELDPDAAVDALPKGIAKCRVNWVQARMIESLGTIKSDAATNALRDQLKGCSSMQGRVAAAQELSRRGEKDLVPAMIAEWNKWDATTRTHYEYPDSLIIFLCHCGDVAAMKALAARFATLPAHDRIKLLHCVTGGQPERSLPPTDLVPIPAEAAAVGEELAISALDDRGVYLSEPRVCDAAASDLAKAWPQRYAFVPSESPFARDLAIATIRNVWRKAHGLEPLPVPVRPTNPAAATDPNIVAGCQWNDGPEVKDVPLPVGKPLTADALFDTIVQLELAYPKDCNGFYVTADRSADHSGFAVQITWRHGPGPGPMRVRGYECLFSVADRPFHRTQGNPPPPDKPQTTPRYGEERWATAKVLEAPADQPVTIRFYAW